MQYKNRLKRVADALEKLGVAGMAIGLFQDQVFDVCHMSGFYGATILLVISIILTMEEHK